MTFGSTTWAIAASANELCVLVAFHRCCGLQQAGGQRQLQLVGTLSGVRNPGAAIDLEHVVVGSAVNLELIGFES